MKFLSTDYFLPQKETSVKSGIVLHACNPSTYKAEAGGLHCDISLSYMARSHFWEHLLMQWRTVLSTAFSLPVLTSIFTEGQGAVRQNEYHAHLSSAYYGCVALGILGNFPGPWFSYLVNDPALDRAIGLSWGEIRLPGVKSLLWYWGSKSISSVSPSLEQHSEENSNSTCKDPRSPHT